MKKTALFIIYFLFGWISMDVLADPYAFTASDIQYLSRFSIKQLPALPVPHSNHVADNKNAASLGKRIFFDTQFSRNKKVACATCHQPQHYFTDGLAQAVGLKQVKRNTPTLLGAAYHPWLFWDGRKDSLWSQALTPLEHPSEHGLSRLEVARIVLRLYKKEFENLFSYDVEHIINTITVNTASPIGSKQEKKNWEKLNTKQKNAVNRAFANVGKLLMAYQRTLSITPAKFDVFIDILNKEPTNKSKLSGIFSEQEVLGLRLFMGKATCASCHNGPLFTNFEFHNIGAPEHDPDNVDLGRYQGIQSLENDKFTCLSPWSDAEKKQCEEILYLKKVGKELIGAFKTPSLRNVAETAPYMHSGQFATLTDVIAHYNKPKPPFFNWEQHPSRPHFDILPLGLSEEERHALIAFLKTLTSSND